MSERIDETHESRHTLWLLAASPTIWILHLLLSYISAAVWCEKFAGRDGSLSTVRWAIAIYTVLALIGIGVTFWIGYRMYSFESARRTTSQDSPESRHQFLGFATILLSSLSALATIYVALAAVFVESCR